MHINFYYCLLSFIYVFLLSRFIAATMSIATIDKIRYFSNQSYFNGTKTNGVSSAFQIMTWKNATSDSWGTPRLDTLFKNSDLKPGLI